MRQCVSKSKKASSIARRSRYRAATPMAMFAKRNCHYLLLNNLPKETLIRLLEEILAMAERFEWSVDDGDGKNNANNKKRLIFSTLGEH